MKILLVDDDQYVREALRTMLERMGHRVTECSLPQHALDAYTFRPASYDIVVTDYDMPGMNGVLLAAALRELNPYLGVVLVSGSDMQSLREDNAGHGFPCAYILQKGAFSAESLGLTVEVVWYGQQQASTRKK